MLIPETYLLSSRGIGQEPTAHGLPRDAVAEAIESELCEAYPSGLLAAVDRLLSENAVVVSFVDSADLPLEGNEAPDRPYVKPVLLGYNDHDGSPLSDFKILFRHMYGADKPPQQYVLFSPPTEEGKPSNLAFRRASYGRLDEEPKPQETLGVPELTETRRAARANNRDYHDFIVVGPASTPVLMGALLRLAGFGFRDRPYDRFELSELNSLAKKAKAKSPVLARWPGAQFAGNVAAMHARAATPKN